MSNAFVDWMVLRLVQTVLLSPSLVLAGNRPRRTILAPDAVEPFEFGPHEVLNRQGFVSRKCTGDPNVAPLLESAEIFLGQNRFSPSPGNTTLFASTSTTARSEDQLSNPYS